MAVLLYCKTSGRAALSAVSMQAMGYLNVTSLGGGYDGWVAAGKPVVKPDLPSFGEPPAEARALARCQAPGRVGCSMSRLMPMAHAAASNGPRGQTFLKQ